MAKFNFKEFMIQKGEKIVLGAALAGMGLFAAMGVSTLLAKENPKAKSDEFAKKAQSTDQAINRKDGVQVDPLPDWVEKPATFPVLQTNAFRSEVAPFEAVEQRSTKRENPKVLGIVEAQVDLVRAPIRSKDMLVLRPDDLFSPDEKIREKSIQMGLLENLKTGALDQAQIQKNKDFVKASSRQAASLGQPPQQAQPVNTGRRPAEANAAQAADQTRSEKILKYVDLDKVDAAVSAGMTPSLSVYPLRMIVVQGTLPLKAQLEEIRRALRLKTLAEAATASAGADSTPGPAYAGIEVQRRIYNNRIKSDEPPAWEDYDHVKDYIVRIGVRKLGDLPENENIAGFLRYGQGLVTPLPELALATEKPADDDPRKDLHQYPSLFLELPSIINEYKKFKEKNKKPPVRSDLVNQAMNRGGDPFAPVTGTPLPAATTGAAALPPSAAVPGGITPEMLPGGRGGGERGGGERGGGKAGAVTSGVATPVQTPNAPTVQINPFEIDHLMIRFLDVNVTPGYTYQYRVRIKMKNPNFEKKDDVAVKTDADSPLLYSDWRIIGTKVEVPVDYHLYAADPVDFNNRINTTVNQQITPKDNPKDFELARKKMKDLLGNQEGKLPVVQFVTWLESVAVEAGKSSEPAGYWAVAEMPVNRGEFIGRRYLTELPMWNAQNQQYILQELPKYGIKGTAYKPKGLLVDYTSKSLLADYAGGYSTYRDAKGEEKSDTSDIELLILNPNGSVTVKRSNDDKKARDALSEKFRGWVSLLREQSKAAQIAESGVAAPGAGRN